MLTVQKTLRNEKYESSSMSIGSLATATQEVQKETDLETETGILDSLTSQIVSELVKFLSSAVFNGIGPIIARRIVKEFSIGTVQVIEKTPKELAKVRGVGVKRISAIKEGWTFQRRIRKTSAELMELRSMTEARKE